MTDPALVGQLARIHRTLELVAFLLAVLVAQASTVGFVVGTAAAVLLAVNALSRFPSTDSETTGDD